MIILASKSPRRSELLKKANIDFIVEESQFDESSVLFKNAIDYVKELSYHKAKTVFDQKGNCVIGADTIVVLNEELLGKPKDVNDAKKMLKKLSGNVHDVYTGVTIMYERITISFVEQSKVRFQNMSDDEIEAYVQTKEPLDKAGGYAIQGLGRQFILEYQGDLENIMGLPIKRVKEVLKELKII